MPNTAEVQVQAANPEQQTPEPAQPCAYSDGNKTHRRQGYKQHAGEGGNKAQPAKTRPHPGHCIMG